MTQENLLHLTSLDESRKKTHTIVIFLTNDSSKSMIARAETDRLMPAIYEASAEPEAWLDVLETSVKTFPPCA